MDKTFYLNSSIDNIIKKADAKGKLLKIAGFANTVVKDRTGDVIVPTAWSKGVSNYRKNPILLWQHNPNQPIGRITKLEITKDGLFVEATISSVAEAKYGIQTLIEDGTLKAFSVGFRVKDHKYDAALDASTITDLELLEISIVSIPANQDSLFSIKKNFNTDEEYQKFISKGSDIKTKNSLIAGITSIEEGHYHTLEFDKNGNGITTFTSHGVNPHVHEISNKSLGDKNNHNHTIRVLDDVYTDINIQKSVILIGESNEGDEQFMADTLETETEDIVKNNIEVESEKEVEVDEKELKTEDEVEVKTETEIVSAAVKTIDDVQLIVSDDVSSEKSAKEPTEIVEETNDDGPFISYLDFDVSKLKAGRIVVFEGDRYTIVKSATKSSPVFDLKQVDINNNIVKTKNTNSVLATELSVINDWDIESGYDLHLIKQYHSVELSDLDRTEIKNTFKDLVTVTERDIYEMKKLPFIKENFKYQQMINKLLNLVTTKNWSDANYIAANNLCNEIKYLKGVNPSEPNEDSEYNNALLLRGHKAEAEKEEKKNMAEHLVDEPIVVDTKGNSTSKEETTAPKVETVSTPREEQLVERAGQTILAAANTTDQSQFKVLQEQLQELQAEIARNKEVISAISSNKMVYEQNSRKENPYSASEMADAYFLAKAYGARDDESLFETTKYGAKFKAVTSVDAFLSNFSTEMRKELEQELVIVPMLQRIAVDAKTFRIPVADEDTDGDVAQFASGTYASGIGDTTNVPASNQHVIKAVEFTPHKFMASTHLAKDEEEDTVLPLVPFLRQAAARRMARALDKAVLRGDATITGFTQSPTNAITAGGGYQSAIRGIVTHCDNAGGTVLKVQTGASTKATPTNIAAARAKMGKYGLRVGTNDLVYLTTTEGYNELVQTADFRTVDTFGPQATYHTGTIGSIYGIPVMVTEFLDNAGSDNNLIGCLVYKKGFLIAERRAMLIETQYEPRQQVTAIYMSTRLDMKPLTTNATYQLDSSYPMAVALESA